MRNKKANPNATSALLIPMLIALSRPALARSHTNLDFDACSENVAATESDDPTHPLLMAIGGLTLGAMGFGAGAAVGAGVADTSMPFGGLGEALLLGSLAGGFALPLGVHAANRQRGSYGLTTLASFTTAAAGWAIVGFTGEGIVVPTIPIMQVAACVAVQSVTTKPRIPKTDDEPTREETFSLTHPQVGFVPQKNGLGVVISGTF